ncbi:MAG: hypothetical protein WKF82_12450 [Nocardioidaceae bacterium]
MTHSCFWPYGDDTSRAHRFGKSVRRRVCEWVFLIGEALAKPSFALGRRVR